MRARALHFQAGRDRLFVCFAQLVCNQMSHTAARRVMPVSCAAWPNNRLHANGIYSSKIAAKQWSFSPARSFRAVCVRHLVLIILLRIFVCSTRDKLIIRITWKQLSEQRVAISLWCWSETTWSRLHFGTREDCCVIRRSRTARIAIIVPIAKCLRFISFGVSILICTTLLTTVSRDSALALFSQITADNCSPETDKLHDKYTILLSAAAETCGWAS